ncbi:hypothetical protein [Haloparvum sp. PAK95]|uniref:hypothetical protein n=1 Tax=Haloparvum sp. PAK95 TaxID=3418962 RepID=UPI003D2EB299
MSRVVTLLTLDAGSVLYNPAKMPREVVLKHKEGELTKARRSDTGDWLTERREELGVNFWEDGRYNSPTSAVATLADRQAFGFRLNGEAVNPLAIADSSQTAETIEVEGLGNGGIVVEDELQLPIAVYTTEEVYYRIGISEDEESDGKLTESIALLEMREGPGGDWDELGRSEPTEAGYLLRTIAEETGMEAVSGDSDEMRKLLGDEQDSFKASRTQEDEEMREQMSIQNDTAFPPSAPKPRPVDFKS